MVAGRDAVTELNEGALFAGRYRIVRTLGGGEFATVYEAIDTSNEMHIALKVLEGARRATLEAHARFAREAEILRALPHASVVRIFDATIAPSGVPYFTMELLNGRTWSAYARTSGRFSSSELCALLTPVADALDEAHRRGVVHRDLKPDNLFLVDDGGVRVKLLDFGLSRLHDALALTRAGTLIGTPRYMAPEQIASERDVDGSVDVFSLGVIAYEALSGGVSPYDTEDVAQLLGAIIHGKRTPLQAHRPDLPDEVAVVLSRAMAVDRRERYRTAGEMVSALHTALRVELSPRAPLALVALSPAEIDVKKPRPEGAAQLHPFEFRDAASVERPSSSGVLRKETSIMPPRPRTSWRWLVPLFGLATGVALGALLWSALR